MRRFPVQLPDLRQKKGTDMYKPYSNSSRKMPALATIVSLTVALLLNPAAVKPATAEVVNNWYVLNWAKKPKLYQVNKTTGALTVLAEATQDTGTSGNTGAAGFDVDSTNGVGYFIPYSNNPASLWKVDLIAGQFTFIATSDARSVTAMDIGNNGDVWIAADSLDGIGQGFGRVNTTTGDSTFLAAGPERISALATSASGVLHAFTYSQRVYTVNTSTLTFTLIGTTQDTIMAADIDGSGDMVLTSFFGNVSKYDFDTNTSTSLFTMRDSNNQTILVEALAVGGPTNGQNLNQVVAEIEAAAAAATAPVPVIANSYRADKLGTVYFAPLSSKLSKAAKKQIEASVIANPSAIYKVTGHVQKSIIARNAKNDADLSLARARAIETYLVSLGAGVNFTVVVDAGLVPAKNGTSDKARRATLYAMTPVVQ